ncbi:glycosyltransferase family 2 protein [Photobacterium aquimaris]|uniref:N-acetylglucosaminyl-diphospho-decaprenol L-rhamnosyltransferase n=1 Tax=Photobacterium aquimaris TaxID=512643 RepID=A0A1Y6L0R8_9GAMM|nr:glycosyltransferase [Photobacterium aquimaris]SMY17005.1 N-acetylglucosaminyl-diphospho-decaprenol L-rhamnosyltransferase [Photobacterium aquimaris]
MINIVVLNWNSSNDVYTLFSSLLNSSYKDFRVIVVDNNSDLLDQDKLGNVIIEFSKYFIIDVIYNKDNLGYASGNNIAIKYIKEKNHNGDIMIVNPDVIFSETALENMGSQLYSSIDCAGVMIKTIDPDTSITYDYLELSGFNTVYKLSEDNKHLTDYLAGSCFLIKRDYIDKGNYLFNDDFFMYFEEVELSIRLKKAGWKLISCLDSNVYRKSNPESRSPNAIFYSARNSFLLYKIHSDFFSKTDLFKYLIKLGLFSLRKFKYKSVKSYLSGVVSGIRL